MTYPAFPPQPVLPRGHAVVAVVYITSDGGDQFAASCHERPFLALPDNGLLQTASDLAQAYWLHAASSYQVAR